MDLTGGRATEVKAAMDLTGGRATEAKAAMDLTGGRATEVKAAMDLTGGRATEVKAAMDLTGGRATEAKAAMDLTEGRATEAKAAMDLTEGRATEVKPAMDLTEGRATEAKPAMDLTEGRATEAKPAMDLTGGRATEAKPAMDLTGGRATEAKAAMDLTGGRATEVKAAMDLTGGRATEAKPAMDLTGGRATEAKAAMDLTGGRATEVKAAMDLTEGRATEVKPAMDLTEGRATEAKAAMDLTEGRATEVKAAALTEFFGRKKCDGESREEYLSAIRLLAAKCDFGANTEMFVNSRFSAEFPGETPMASTRPGPEPVEVQTEAVTPTVQRATPKGGPQNKSGGKTRGAADGAGVDFECNYQTLLYLRMLFQSTLFNGFEFQLASNMAAAGLFDDIVLRHRKDPDTEWDVSLLQLKTKKNNNIQKADLLGISGAFSLVNYCDSYETIKSTWNLQGHHNVIIFTNAGIADCFVEEVASDPLLFTSGKAVSFKAGGDIYEGLCELVVFKQVLTNLRKTLTDLHGQADDFISEKIKTSFKAVLNENKAVESWTKELISTPTVGKLEDLLKKLEPVRDEATYASFLSKLQVYVNQTKGSKLEEKIREELAKLWKCSVKDEADKMFRSLIDGVKSFREKGKGDLTQDSSLWLDLIKSQLVTLSKSTIEGLTKTGAEFESESLRVLHEAIPSEGIVNVRVDSRTEASSLRVHQALAKFRGKDPVMHVNLNAFLEREADVLAAWNTKWCRVLVLECNKEIREIDTKLMCREVFEILGKENNKKLVVLIAAEKHGLYVRFRALSKALNYEQKHIEDNFTWDDMTVATKENIRQTKVKLQGAEFTLSTLVGQAMHSFAVNIGPGLISRLLTGDTSCGKDLDKESDIFVERWLLFNSKFPTNSKKELNNRAVNLVVAEPGMGKSTYLTHLANRAKTEDPSAWIVLIRLNDCADYLAKMDKNNLNEDAARNFLEHFALSSPANNLEKFLFQSLEHTRVIFLDGVDEVNPHYEVQIFKLLSFLKDFKFAKLWVSSRPVCKSQLELIFGVKSFSLSPFSNDDQREFLNKKWESKDSSIINKKFKEVTESFLTFFANSVGKDNTILEVPLMIAMVADMFEKQALAVIKGNSKFEVKKRINVMSLYEGFVRETFDRFCDEKRIVTDRNNAANKDVEEKMMQRLYHHHRLAALMTLFNSDEIGRLQFGNNATFEGEDFVTFLKEVSEGREKTGFIVNVIDGIPKFVHRTFAEFFAAAWLSRNFAANKEFTKKTIFDPDYKLVGEMFNQLLSEGHSLLCAVLNRDVRETRRVLSDKSVPCDVNEVEKGGRTALHLAVFLSGTDHHEDFIAIVDTLIQHEAHVDIVDTITDWTPLQYAEQLRAWKALAVFLKNGVKSNEAWPKPDTDVMLEAASDASVDVVRYLAEERGGDLQRRGPKGETMVHVAAEGGNVEVLGYLADKRLSLHEKDKNNNTALHYATCKDSVSGVRFLLEHGVDLVAVNSRGLTAFHVAALSGEYQVMDVLLDKGASIEVTQIDKLSREQFNASFLCATFAGDLDSIKLLVARRGYCRYHRDAKGHTAAWVAMFRERFEVMNWLLLREAVGGDSPLHGACQNGEHDIVKFLLSQPGADIETKAYWDRTPLHTACQSSDSAMVELLLSNGASSESRDKDGSTLLHTASMWGKKQVVELLLRNGAPIGETNNRGRTPLDYACRGSDPAVVELLLSNGADTECCDDDANTPLHTASRLGKNEAVESLLRYEANVGRRNLKGETPLHCASASGETYVMELLLSKGAYIRCRDKDGNTALHNASRGDKKEPGEFLLRHGAEIDATNNKGETPLHCAEMCHRTDLLELLLAKGADFECRDNDGNTPLHIASSNGSINVVVALLLYEAKTDARNNNGETPLDCATKRGKTYVAKLLLSHEPDTKCRDN